MLKCCRKTINLPPPVRSIRGRRIPIRRTAGWSQCCYRRSANIFDKLGFNPVFYGEVLAGSRMPNLMYMTTFSNKASRDEHWKAFVDDSDWKKLSALPEYQNNVSHADIFLLFPTDYSDI